MTKTVNIRDQLEENETTGAALLSGALVGEYVIEARIGSGGCGDVYAARHPVIGKRVAIKILAERFAHDSEMAQRFITEARAVNEIQHRNIVDVFGFGQFDDGRNYMVMELLEGRTLEVLLKEKKKLSLEQAKPILRAVASAIDAAHAAGIAHRDLKPENVYLADIGSDEPFVKLLDFGIAKLIGEEEIGERALGTVTYMSPEQCEGEDVDARTDVYSFGVLAYRVLTGKLPHDGERAIDVYLAKRHDAPAPPGISPEIDAAIMAMLAKEAARRPADLAAAVAPILDAKAPAPPSPTPQHEPKRDRAEPHPIRSIVVPVLIALLLAAAIAGGLQLIPPSGPPLRMAMRRYAPEELLRTQQQPLIAALQKELGRPVEFSTIHVAGDLVEALGNGSVDIASLNAHLYVQAKEKHPDLELIARPRTPGGPTFEAYIIGRADQPVNSLADLEGRVFCYVPGSGSGYYYARYLLHRAGVHPDRAFKSTRLAEDHLAALRLVAGGHCDAAGIYAGIFVDARKHGVAPELFTILATAKIPYDPWVAGPGVSEQVRQQMQNVLVGLKMDPIGQVVGFDPIVDSDYDDVREVARYLEKHGIN